MTPGFGAGLVIPDLWQQDAVRALQQGKDVVVQAPTGSGKTYIFELLYPNLKTQAVFTVPTRAAPTRVHTLHPRLQRSPIMHHKRLMMHHIHDELDGTAGTPLRLIRSTRAQDRLRRHYTASRNSMYRKRLMMDQNLLREL